MSVLGVDVVFERKSTEMHSCFLWDLREEFLPLQGDRVHLTREEMQIRVESAFLCSPGAGDQQQTSWEQELPFYQHFRIPTHPPQSLLTSHYTWPVTAPLQYLRFSSPWACTELGRGVGDSPGLTWKWGGGSLSVMQTDWDHLTQLRAVLDCWWQLYSATWSGASSVCPGPCPSLNVSLTCWQLHWWFRKGLFQR